MALLIMIIALTLMTGMTLSMMRTILLTRQHLDRCEQQAQAELLALHGLETAATLLREHPERTADEWEVSLPDRDGALGRITMKVEEGSESGRRKLIVSAEVPADAVHRTRVTLTADISLPDKGQP